MTQIPRNFVWNGLFVTSSDSIAFRVFDGVYRRSLMLDPRVIDLLDRDPGAASMILDQAAESIVVDAGMSPEGVFYILEGADPTRCTPMQYGGFFLERDREVLSELRVPTVLWIEAGADAYLDFVADLPAELFGWDPVATGVSVASMRSMRSGQLLTTDGLADALLQREATHV